MPRRFKSKKNSRATMENATLKSLDGGLGLSVDWTSEEQSIFEDLMKKHDSEVPMDRYASIAHALPGKRIRDIVLRSRWIRENERPIMVNDDVGRLMEHNGHVLDQIDEHYFNRKIHENTDLLSQARDNLLTILNDLPKTFCDGMPDFPFKINEELANSVLPPTSLPKK